METSPSPAKTKNSTTSDNNDGTADLKDNSPLTKNDLQSALKLHLDPTIDKLQAQLDAVGGGAYSVEHTKTCRTSGN